MKVKSKKTQTKIKKKNYENEVYVEAQKVTKEEENLKGNEQKERIRRRCGDRELKSRKVKWYCCDNDAVEEETRQEGKEENKEPKHKEDNQSKPSKGSTEETMKKSVNGAALDDAVSQKTYIPDFGNVGIKKNCFPVTNATSILKILMI